MQRKRGDARVVDRPADGKRFFGRRDACLGIDPRPDAHPLTRPERFEGDPARHGLTVEEALRELVETADVIGEIGKRTGRSEPDVRT